jgi:hypothetical protein
MLVSELYDQIEEFENDDKVIVTIYGVEQDFEIVKSAIGDVEIRITTEDDDDDGN